MFGIDLIALVQLLGYPGLFLVIFLESGVFFGFFLPGASLLFIAGMLASLGILNIWLLVPILFAAAVLGDAVGYWFGAWIGRAIYKRPNSRFFRQEHVRIAHDFFERYGKAAVLLARFVPIARTFVPILAGVGGMTFRVFLFYNVLGAIVWACGVSLLGYSAGRYVPNADRYLTLFIGGIIAATALPLLIAWWRQWKEEHAVCPRAVVFDLDNTLAMAFEPLPPRTAAGLASLLEKIPVAIVSGATIGRMEQYVLPELPGGARLDDLYLFPDTGALCYVCENGTWRPVYDHRFAKDDFEKIVAALEEGIRATGICADAPCWGERILARENQITFAGLGVDAPGDKKRAWDPDRAKRAKLKSYLDERLAELPVDIRISSRTAIDITQRGVDKAKAVRFLAERLGIEPKEMLFVGDDLGEHGNDAVVIPTGIATRQTSGPKETARVVEELLAACA
ncbi:hypothetical protein A3C21_01300 [Candidatus Kaiserbacteria bacterium RIFCSPHIGHO2_02_FULL_59_21]|uniref:VTT domain-containing protein n=1 Tax=Candidatus Kaiserbacteria bacterium RIFCSPHIGHO2_02_FULL_59_21 TaxID=1798500 RepID=A0A1F6E2H3_9BACT|nr:MAG: hypothetical protein A3C21_01300 [Candidatus Kaiserbacteria bacterium RIFCSPHIGHO2_02_FULL_59_21]OGG80692.1 MAG: hypothetical protein A2952_00470 [Candidatus Kaiserbacteria bacterium RIFCSPLOWO2_01_FULL_59_34]OGG85807.1 MAG: hypothetical protein A3I47_00220 [Candidatus Kaiserbacteria bacterium RIFCSPLOWO2_02_FULL_59_19]